MLNKLFGKKKVEDGVENQPNEGAVVKKTKQKKKNELMSSVLKESVVESVVSEMFQNKNFVFEVDGEKLAIGLLLDTEAVGGFSKKQSKDEAKGSIIEQINGSKIRVLITPKFMEEEKILFIPDAVTLDHMNEYVLLTEAPYTICYVHEDGTIEETDKPMTFGTVLDYIESDSDVYDFVSSFDDRFVNDEEVEEESDDDSAFMKPEEEGVSYDENEVEYDEEGVPFGENYYEKEPPVDSGYDEFSADFNPNWEDESDYGDIDTSYGGLSGELENDEEYSSEEDDMPEEDVEVTEEQVMQTVSRTFFTDNLNLEISTDAFDAEFMNDMSFRPFVEDRGEGWMNEYLSLLSQEANSELDTMHRQNLQSLRQEYFNLLTGYVENLQREMDYKDPNTGYGEIYDTKKKERDSEKENIANKAEEKRKQLRKLYSEGLEKAKEEAISAATKDYENKYGQQHNQELNNVEPMLKQEIDMDFNNFLNDFYRIRRDEAGKQLDLGITETLVKINKRYKEVLAEENKLYKEHRNNLIQFIRENRENDVAHDKALAKELAQSEKADKVMSEMTAKLESQTAEFNARRESLLADIDDIKRNRDKEFERLKEQYDNNLDELRKELQASRDNYHKLTEEYARLESKKEDEYRDKLLQKDAEKTQLAGLVDTYERRNKKTGILVASIALVAIVASLFVGLFFGMRNGVQIGEQNVRSQIEQQVEQRVSEHFDTNETNE